MLNTIFFVTTLAIAIAVVCSKGVARDLLGNYNLGLANTATRDPCGIPLPIFYVGGYSKKTGNVMVDVWLHHVWAIGNKHTPLLHYYATGHGREWMRKWSPSVNAKPIDLCSNWVSQVAQIVGVAQCDEYPYNSTYQGGPVNYEAGDVSLMLVLGKHNSVHGGLLGGFYKECGLIDPGRKSWSNLFLVVPVPPNQPTRNAC